MDLSFLRLFFDFGLVVLIWLVQLIIYPSFKYLEKPKLLEWHTRYSQRISVVVIPLMMGQLLITILQLLNGSTISYIIALLVLAVWLITFLHFMPLHRRISKNTMNNQTLIQLVSVNWWRTLIWTVIFLLAVLEVTY